MNSYFLYNTIGGFTELSTSNQYIFTDTTSNDILIHTDLSNQNILLGTDSNDTSAIHIAQAEITFNRNLKFNSNFGLGGDYSEKFVLGTGNAKFKNNIYVMNNLGVGTSNVNHLVTLLGPSNNIANGPNLTAYFSENTPTNQETTRPVFEIVNWDRDDIQINLDCYNDGSNILSSSETGTFQIRKNLGRLQFMSGCNMPNSNVITNELYPALTINSNSFIGIATRDADHRITVRAEQSNVLGPHMVFYINSDSNYPLTQHLNWDHDNIAISFDAKFTGTDWISSSDTGNFKIHKENGRFVFYSACNAHPGDNISHNWHSAIAINSNSFIGIGTRDPTYKLTVRAEQANILGPHIAYYISPDSNHALYHQLNWDHDNIHQGYDCYFNGTDWISSSANSFVLQKSSGRLNILNSCNTIPGNIITGNLFTALSVNSNSFIGIGTSNPTHKITVIAEQDSYLGPHMAFYLKQDLNYPVTQYLNWKHDDASITFDAKFNPTLSNWISSSATSFKIHKQDDQFVFYNACNANPGDDISHNWHPAIAINSNSFIGIGTKDPTYKFTVRAEQSNILGPHSIYYISPDSNHALYHQLNWDHDSIHQGYDCFYNGSNWISSSDTGSFIIQKSNRNFNILSTCNANPGDVITDRLYTSIGIDSNSFIGIGTSNPTHKMTIIGESSSYLGPNMAFYLKQDLNYPVTQYLNWKHNDASITFDAMFDPNMSNWISSSETSFKIHKQDDQFVFYNACNANPGDDISHNWHPAIAINSNSFIGIGTKDPTYKFTVRAEQSNILGPHSIYYISPDSNHALYHQLNWDHDSIHQGYDCFYNGSNWISSSDTGNFIIQKSMGNLNILNTCNIIPGNIMTHDLFPALSINSNSYIGIGTSNPDHRLTIQGPANNIHGPHIATYLNDSNNPVFQIYSSNNDMISLNFDTWWNGYNYISSSDTANFQIIKRDGKLIFQSANPNIKGSIVDTTWITGLTVNSNGFIGINNSNPLYPLDIQDSVIFRNDIIVAGSLIPGSNRGYDGANGGYDIGANNMRFRDLYLSGRSIDMDNLVLRKDYYSGGLQVYDNTTSKLTRVWAKELLVGDPTNLLNSNTYLIKAESNGLQFQNVTSNVSSGQNFFFINNLSVGPTNIGIGISNAEKTLHLVGDYKQNPSATNYVNWLDNNVFRGELDDLNGTKDRDNVNSWCGGAFSTQTSASSRDGNTQLNNPNGLTLAGGSITVNGQDYIQIGYTSLTRPGLFELTSDKLSGSSYASGIYNPNSFSIAVTINSPYALSDSDSAVDTGYTWTYAVNDQVYNQIFTAQESSIEFILHSQDTIKIYAIPSSGSGTINSGFVFHFSLTWAVTLGAAGSGVPPTYCKNGGYNNGPFIRFDNSSRLILSTPTNVSAYTNSGLSLLAAVRFYDEITSNSIITLSNNSSILSLYRDSVDPSILVFKAQSGLNNVTFSSPTNTIKQNEWALFSIEEVEVNSNITMYKNGNQVAMYTRNNLSISNMSFSPSSESYIGSGNMDISTLYLFDRPLFLYEMDNLTNFIKDSGRQSMQINTRNQQYPPFELTQDTSGWQINNLISGNSVYSQTYNSTYYGNGTYKIWANTESDPAYNAFYQDNTYAWLSAYPIYTRNGTSTGSMVPAGSNPITKPSLYMELPNEIVLSSYSITAYSDAPYQTPSEWKLYGSPNNIKWTLLDKQTAQTGWAAGNQVLYNVNTIEAYKYFKLETYKNDSIFPTNIAISRWLLFGREYMLYLDGTGLGLGTALVKERLHVQGNALITQNLTIGEVNDIYVNNIQPYPEIAATNSNQVINGQIYKYSANYNNNIAYKVFNNNNLANTWTGTPGIYGTDGVYNGAITTMTYTNTNTTITTNTYLGDWIQIQIPDLIQLNSYTIIPGANPDKNAPSVFHIAGSKDGIKWYDLDTQYYTWLANSGAISFKVQDQTTIGVYKYFRLIISQIGINIAVSQVQIASIILYGGILETSKHNDSLLKVIGDIHVTQNINITSKYYDKKQILNLDIKEIVYNTNSLLDSWGSMNQDNENLRPIFYKTLGYRNAPYVSFVNKSMVSIPGTLNLQETHGGFSMSTLIKFTNVTGSENIMTLYTSSYGTPILLEVKRTGTNISFSIYNNNGTAANTITTNTSPIILNEWFVLGVRYTTALMKSEIFINNTITSFGIGVVTTSDKNYDQIVVGSWPTGMAPGDGVSCSMCIGGMYAWTISLPDQDLFETSDLMMQGQPQLHVEDKTRMSSGIEGGLTVYGTGYGTTICTYPPGDLNNNNAIIKNKLYGNGAYNIYSSSYLALSDSADAYNAFQTINTNSWISENTYSTGNYIGPEIIKINNTSYTGEWLQINLPEETIIQEYSITPDTYNTNSPKTWVFLGSKDGLTWVLLDTRTNYIFNNNNKLSFPIASNTTSYMCYKIIISQIQTNLNSGNVAINQLYLYGKTRESISTQDGTTVVFDKIGVNITNPAASLHVAGFSVLSGIKIISTGASNVTLPSYSGSSANVGVSNDNMGTNILMQNNTTDNYIRFLSANNEIARFTGTGKLGIGTQNPTYSLQLSTDSAAKPATATWTVSSDKRIKTDIQDANLDVCYSNVKNIQLRRYTWLSNVMQDRSQLGWIAQEIETVFPKSVTTIPMSSDGFIDFKMLNSDQIYASLFGCVQKLQKMNEDLEERIRVLESKNL